VQIVSLFIPRTPKPLLSFLATSHAQRLNKTNLPYTAMQASASANTLSSSNTSALDPLYPAKAFSEAGKSTLWAGYDPERHEACYWPDGATRTATNFSVLGDPRPATVVLLREPDGSVSPASFAEIPSADGVRLIPLCAMGGSAVMGTGSNGRGKTSWISWGGADPSRQPTGALAWPKHCFVEEDTDDLIII
jgi:hypothetical protein